MVPGPPERATPTCGRTGAGRRAQGRAAPRPQRQRTRMRGESRRLGWCELPDIQDELAQYSSMRNCRTAKDNYF